MKLSDFYTVTTQSVFSENAFMNRGPYFYAVFNSDKKLRGFVFKTVYNETM